MRGSQTCCSQLAFSVRGKRGMLLCNRGNDKGASLCGSLGSFVRDFCSRMDCAAGHCGPTKITNRMVLAVNSCGSVAKRISGVIGCECTRNISGADITNATFLGSLTLAGNFLGCGSLLGMCLCRSSGPGLFGFFVRRLLGSRITSTRKLGDSLTLR